ncbi:hypothetical protein K4F52_002837 [Lecanicillium sp. MT-2017a]|nr:hypothetical protein K4F52_002837 [Lecanicillium sp. MT-2017a]
MAVTLHPLIPQIYNYDEDDPAAFKPMFNLSIPETQLGKDSTLHISEQTITLSDQDEFVRLLHRVWQAGTFPASVRCDPAASLSKLDVTATLDRSIYLNALNQVEGLSLADVGLIIPRAENGDNVKGAFGLPNRLPVKFDIGTLVVDVLIAGTRVAEVTIDHVIGPPGNSSLPFHGQLFLPDIIANLSPILSSQADALSRGNIEVNVTGNANKVNGQHIEFIERFLNNVMITLPIPVTALVVDIAGSLVGGNAASLGSALSNVMGNDTFMAQILGHWEKADNRKAGMKSSSWLEPFGGGDAVVHMFRLIGYNAIIQ